MIIHLVKHGHTPHPMPMPPSSWPVDHRWVGEDQQRVVNCPDCLEAIASKDLALYSIHIDTDGTERHITCRRCGKRSYNPEDIKNHYCGNCHAFLDDIWPPAKKWWLENQPKSAELENLKSEAVKALQCLYLAVPQDIADDVNDKVKAYMTALESHA
jgi:ribosomal protein S27AE